MRLTTGLPIRRWLALFAGALLLVLAQNAIAADPPPAAAAPATPETVVRRVTMRDARSAVKFADQLKTLQATGVFGGTTTVVPGKPTFGDLAFITTGNYVLITGEKDRLDKYMPSIELMAFMFERPRAHLELNMRVVQLTGPANTDVIQMTETVRGMIDAQRMEVVTAFADLQDYLLARLKRRKGDDLLIYTELRRLFPTIGDGERPLTVQEILLLLMVDRALPDLPAVNASPTGPNADRALLDFQTNLSTALQDPHASDAQIARDIHGKLSDWEQVVTAAAKWCGDSAKALDSRDGQSVSDFLSSLKDPRCPLPTWVSIRVHRSIAMSQRLYPALARRQAHDSLMELQHRFQGALDREKGIQDSIAALDGAPATKDGTPGHPESLRRRLFDLQNVANDLVSVPMALFQAVAGAAGDTAPHLRQLIGMIKTYADDRASLDNQFRTGSKAPAQPANYERLEMLEAALNQWLRRGSEALGRALEQQFYNHYVDQLRLLANRQLGHMSSRDILSSSAIENVPDVVQDILLSDSSVNLFVSNSVSLQFEPDTVGSVSATVASRLPSQTSLTD